VVNGFADIAAECTADARRPIDRYIALGAYNIDPVAVEGVICCGGADIYLEGREAYVTFNNGDTCNSNRCEGDFDSMFIVVGVIGKEVRDVIMVAHDKVLRGLVVTEAGFDLVGERFPVFWAGFKEDSVDRHYEGGFSWLVRQSKESQFRG